MRLNTTHSHQVKIKVAIHLVEHNTKPSSLHLLDRRLFYKHEKMGKHFSLLRYVVTTKNII